MKVIFIKNRKAGPYTIKHLDNKYLLVSHYGPFINSDWMAESPEACIENVKAIFGDENVEVKTYEKNHDGIWAIYKFMTKPMFTSQISGFRKIEFTWIFGFGYEINDFSDIGNEGCVLHVIHLPFVRLTFGQYKDYEFC